MSSSRVSDGNSPAKENEKEGSRGSTLKFNKKHPRPIEAWSRAISIRQACHSSLSTKYAKFDKSMNTVNVTLTALSSSAIFASMHPTGGSSGTSYLPFGAGAIAVASTILQSVQKALQYAQLAEQHKVANRQLTKIKFRLEVITGENFEDDGTLNMERLTEWVREYEDLLESAPIIPQYLFEKEREKVALREEGEAWEYMKNDSDGKIIAGMKRTSSFVYVDDNKQDDDDSTVENETMKAKKTKRVAEAM
mmetsp:Transcript_23292/g.34532  ORF Transcript_23292/g.34532 Transcript_23292/m.34532 type:complete len:250 (+) Transcript_23292:69-818(+)